MFENMGFCNAIPAYIKARVQHENNNLFLCESEMCFIDNEKVFYDFSSLGNIILHQPVMEGEYQIALFQECPSSVLRMTYIVNFTNKRKELC